SVEMAHIQGVESRTVRLNGDEEYKEYECDVDSHRLHGRICGLHPQLFIARESVWIVGDGSGRGKDPYHAADSSLSDYFSISTSASAWGWSLIEMPGGLPVSIRISGAGNSADFRS